MAAGGLLVAAACGTAGAVAGSAMILVPAVALAGTLTMASAWLGGYRERCPGCRAVILETETAWWRTGRRCGGCNRYVEGDERSLWLTPEARVQDSAVFESPLPDDARFPPSCAACLAPATRACLFEATLLTDEHTRDRRAKVAVPHCDAHDDGADVFVLPSGAPVIRFRAHGYWRAFCDANRTLILPAPSAEMLLAD